MFPKVKLSNRANDWSIPSEYDFSDFPLDITTEQLQSVVIAIWKQYMLHDEVQSAIIFLENAPYRVRDSAATKKALFLTKQSIAWIYDNETAILNNSPENTESEAGTPLPRNLSEGSQEANRFNLIVENLSKTPSSILDLGSMDGGFTNRYALMGYQAVGIDLSTTSVALANRKAKEFNTGAKFFVSYFKDISNLNLNQKFDYITSTDTYEHIMDRVNDMLIPAKNLMNENGKFLLCTPYGAWMRGNYIEWAHPWLYKRLNGTSWLHPNPRFHLIAPSIWSVAADFREAGFHIEECYVALCLGTRDVENQGNIFIKATHGKKINKPLNIVFDEAHDEAMILANKGHSVTIYSLDSCELERIEHGVNLCHRDKFSDLECDIVVHSMPLLNIKAKETIDISKSMEYFTQLVNFIVKTQ
jgi:cyclopropane fatty-acyl-phospholipid synthase-like methyltransferase